MTPTVYSEKCLSNAIEYIEGVLAGQIVTGDLVKRCVQRHVDDPEALDKLIRFSIHRAMRVFRFFSLLRHSKGE